jgi:hypothetical protein
MGENEKLLSDLGKYSVVDADGTSIGKIRDVIFDEKASPWFVVEGGFFEETFEKLGIRADIDPLIPEETIAEMQGTKITLKHNRMQLLTTAEKEWQEQKEKLAIKAQPATFRQQFLWVQPKLTMG